MTDAWWYEKSGQPAGPVPFTTLQRLAGTGELKRTTLVWADGMANWARAETVALLSFPSSPPPLGTPPPPPLAPPPPPLDTTAVAPPPPPPEQPAPSAPEAPRALGSGAAPDTTPRAPANWLPQPRPATAAGAVAEPGELNVAVLLLLSIVTLGVYGAIHFFQTARAYERLAGIETRFALYFWLMVGCVVLSTLVHPLFVGTLVFEFLTLGEALRARREAMARWQLTPAVATENTHWLYLGLGTLLAPLLVGLVFLVLQAKKWFDDWNAIRAAAIARG